MDKISPLKYLSLKSLHILRVYIYLFKVPVTLQDKTTTRMMMVGESCPVKACLSYIVGGAMGAFMGLFQVATNHKYSKQRP